MFIHLLIVFRPHANVQMEALLVFFFFPSSTQSHISVSPFYFTLYSLTLKIAWRLFSSSSIDNLDRVVRNALFVYYNLMCRKEAVGICKHHWEPVYPVCVLAVRQVFIMADHSTSRAFH